MKLSVFIVCYFADDKQAEQRDDCDGDSRSGETRVSTEIQGELYVYMHVDRD